MNRLLKRLLPLVALAALGQGCVTLGKHRVLKSRVETLEQRLDLMQKKFYAETGKVQHLLGGRISDLRKLSSQLGRLNASLGSKLSDLQADLNGIRGKIEVMEFKMQKAIRDMDSIKDFVDDKFNKSLSGLPPGTPKDKAAMYEFSLRMLRSGKTRDGRTILRHFINEFPKDDLADEAQFYIGESYFLEKKWAQAIKEYKTVESVYPKGNILGKAIMRLAEAALRMNECSTARTVYL
ncbi:MAG: tetratricopeptide repeat protein, partial [Myxococcales bacterium]|nr:tetratricopeptide repeat protein [Myxococcales bacterium]